MNQCILALASMVIIDSLRGAPHPRAVDDRPYIRRM